MSPRICFIDCETVRLAPGPATIWELAIVTRGIDALADDHEIRRAPDTELAWHIRSDQSVADAGALKVGGYYERCKAQALETGAGKLIHDSEEPPDALALDGPEIARAVAQHLSGAILVGANVGSFDVPHLDAYLRAHGECLAADYHYLDIGSLAIGWAHGSGLLPAKPLKLDQALRLCGLDPDAYDAHTALGDARAVRDIWDVVTGGTS